TVILSGLKSLNDFSWSARRKTRTCDWGEYQVKKGNVVLKIKKFKTLSILLVATLALAACQNDQADSTESAGSASQSSSSSEEQQTSQLSTEYYSSYISDGTYQTNSASGITAGVSSQANAENLERGLYDLAKNIFPTEDYSLQEGQVIGEDQTLAYLTAQSDENPDGLNP